MKKTRLFFQFVGIGIFTISLLIAGCTKEGPMGAAGADGLDGTDGSDGTASCTSCHESGVKKAIEAQFYFSGHKRGEMTADHSDWSTSCVQCHSHEGFLQYADGATLTSVANIRDFECGTCHSIHESFAPGDYALRLKDAVLTSTSSDDKSGATMDLSNETNANSNLCANCHRTRTLEPLKEAVAKEVADVTVYKLSSRTGPHHGPQANVVYGVGFAEIAGDVTYPTAGASIHLNKASCTGCHMAPFDAAKTEGGHTYLPSLKECNTCHGVEEANFDHGGLQTLIAQQMDMLRDRLVLIGAMTKTTGVDGDVYAAYTSAAIPMVQAQAFYNWNGLREDRSMGAHNPAYVKALLLNTNAAMLLEPVK